MILRWRTFLVLVLIIYAPANSPSYADDDGKKTGLSGSATLRSSGTKPLSELLGSDCLQVEGSEIKVGKNRGVKIKVRNSSDRPVLFDGDKATAVLSGKTLDAPTLSQFQKASNPEQGAAKTALHCVETTVTMGAFPTISDALEYSGTMKETGDQKRKQDEFSRFDKRALWPNDTSEGFLFFRTNRPLKDATFTLPAHTLYKDEDQVVLTATPH